MKHREWALKIARVWPYDFTPTAPFIFWINGSTDSARAQEEAEEGPMQYEVTQLKVSRG